MNGNDVCLFLNDISTILELRDRFDIIMHRSLVNLLQDFAIEKQKAIYSFAALTQQNLSQGFRLDDYVDTFMEYHQRIATVGQILDPILYPSESGYVNQSKHSH